MSNHFLAYSWRSADPTPNVANLETGTLYPILSVEITPGKGLIFANTSVVVKVELKPWPIPGYSFRLELGLGLGLGLVLLVRVRVRVRVLVGVRVGVRVRFGSG